MKMNFINIVFAIFIMLLFIDILSNRIVAQNIGEPPIPVNYSYTQIEDSLMTVFENLLPTDGLAFIYILKKCDSLQLQLQKSSAENTAHFTWLYTLVALLGAMNIVLLLSTSRIRKELAQIRHLEYQQKLAASMPLPEERIPLQIQNEYAHRKHAKSQTKNIRGRKKLPAKS